MSENNTQVIHRLCTEQAKAFEAAADLLPEQYRENHNRILAACMIAHALDLNPATVMFNLHQKTPPQAAQKAEKPEKPEKPQKTETVETWPQKIDGVWTDSAMTVYNPAQHAFNKTTGTPSVKSDGTFRSSRQGKKANKKAQATAPVDTPVKTEPATEPDGEAALIEANQVLASFKGHVSNATTKERLEGIGGQIELMGFTPDELTIARRWIAERAESLELEES